MEWDKCVENKGKLVLAMSLTQKERGRIRLYQSLSRLYKIFSPNKPYTNLSWLKN